jgi:N-acetylglucosaminyl-diphospho-decaprenol L-rhamnosyltransferase
MAAPQLSVVVVSHDSDAVLPRCMAALHAQRGLRLEIVLVDNGSCRPPVASLGADQVLCNPDNPGFAVACNQGAARARAPWLLFLNPDCFPEPDALARLLDIAALAPVPGVLGAQLLDPDGAPQAASLRLDPTPARLWRALWRGRGEIERAPVKSMPGWQPAEAVSGALMLMPRAAFDAVGGFDEGYRLHFEDLDLCRRLRDSGYSVGFTGEVRVPHLKGSSSRARPFWVAWQKHRGLRRYFERFDAASLGRVARVAFRLLLALAVLPMLASALRTRLSRSSSP